MTSIDYIGLDIHKKTISFCAKAQDGTILDQGTIAARRDTLLAETTLSRPGAGARSGANGRALRGLWMRFGDMGSDGLYGV